VAFAATAHVDAKRSWSPLCIAWPQMIDNVVRVGRGAFVRAAVLFALGIPLVGCASLQELDQTPYAATFPTAMGRTYYLKKSPFGSTILVCDGGPREAVCFEKPN
jgi:hypothetical protein